MTNEEKLQVIEEYIQAVVRCMKSEHVEDFIMRDELRKDILAFMEGKND